MNSKKLIAATLMLVVALAFPALGAKYTWSDSGVVTNNWTNAARWTGGPSSFPNAAGDVAFSWSDLRAWRHLFLNQDITIGSLSWYGDQLYVEPGTPAGRFIVSDGGVPTVWSNQIHYGFTINAGIVLDSDLRLWHYGDAWDSWEAYLNGQITSTGKLTVTHSMSPGLNRAFVIGGTVSNTYSGGTVLDAGSIAGSIFRAGKNGAFGLGDVTVSDDAVLDLTDKGATDDMIYNAAALRLNQSSTSRSTVRLASGVNESVRALYINGVQYDSGTYGSHASAATKFINRTLDRFFTNTGVLTVLESGGAAGYIQCTNTVLAFSGVSSCVMGGTNNMYIAGALRWTNETTGTSGTMTPTDGSWAFTVNLSIGPNKVTVSGMNSVGALCEDSVTVMLTSPPAITNEVPKDVLVTSAKACGNLTATNFAPTTVKLYYGTTDKGTVASAWGTEVNLGILPQGRIEYLIANLTAVTYYRYYATNSSGEAWSPVTTAITPATPFNPAGYAKVLTITFAGYSGAETLTNFPAMVKLDTGIATFSYGDFLSGSNDIRFVDVGGTELYYEIDTWNTVGSSYLWVQVPVLKTNTQIKMYYSKAGVDAPSYRTDGSVWSENYALVQHMGDDNANPIADSTANRNTGIRDLTARADAKIGGGQQFDLGDSIRVTNNATIQNRKISLQVWVKYSHAGCDNWARFFDKVWDSSFSLNRQNNTDRAQTDMRTDTGVGLSIASTVATGDNAWHLIHATKGASTMKLYVDGVEQGNVNNTVDLRINNNDLYIGHNGGGGSERFTGLMDEARVSSVQRSADWIKAEYVGQNAPQSFGAYAVSSTAPCIAITNAPYQMVTTPSYTVVGTNSQSVCGDMWWTNPQSGDSGKLNATPNWSFICALANGRNVVTINASNALGQTTSASVVIMRGTYANAWVWDGGGATPVWSDKQNWVGDVAPVFGSTCVLVFDGETGLSATNDLAGSSALGTIVFSDTAGAFCLGGTNGIDLHSGIVNNSASSQTVAVDVTLHENVEMNCQAGDVRCLGAMASDGALGITKKGAYNLYLLGNNTYSGLTTVEAGFLGGYGSAFSAIQAKNGTTVAPGGSIGTLSGSALTMDAGSSYDWEVDHTGPTTDIVHVSGNLSLPAEANSVTVTLVNASGGNGKFTAVLFEYGTLIQGGPGSLKIDVGMSGYNPAYSPTAAFVSNNSIVVDLKPIPEGGALMSLLLVGGIAVRRMAARRKAQ